MSASPRGPRLRLARLRLARRLGAGTAVFASAGLIVGLSISPAAAIGTPMAICPSGQVSHVEQPDYPVPPGHPRELSAGFYARSGGFAPPDTYFLCRTVAGSGPSQPLLKLFTGTCPFGYLPFGVPDEPGSFGPPVTVTWGTWLPGGWYVLGDTSDSASHDGWVTVCWTPFKPAGAS
jgi:hypothetical protein